MQVITTTQRQSARNAKTVSQPRKCHGKIGDRSQTKTGCSVRKQPRRQQKSTGSNSKNDSRSSNPNLAPTSAVKVDSASSGGKEESGDVNENVEANDVAIHRNPTASSQQQPPSLPTSKSKSNRARQSSLDHTTLPNQHIRSSTANSVKDKSVSGCTQSSPNQPPQPIPTPNTAVARSTRSHARKSLQESSFEVSFERIQSLSPPGVAVPFAMGTKLDTSPSSSSTSSQRTTRPASGKPSSADSSIEDSVMPSSQQLADFFLTMTPLPTPISPEREQLPSGNLLSAVSSTRLIAPHPSTCTTTAVLLPSLHSNSATASAPNQTSTPALLTPVLGASHVISTPMISHSDAPFLSRFDTNPNPPSKVNISLIPHSGINGKSQSLNTTNASGLSSSTAAVSTSCSNSLQMSTLFMPSTTQFSITTQPRVTSLPFTSVAPVTQSERQPRKQTAKSRSTPPKPTFSSIYQQLVTDKKIKPSKSTRKKPPRKKKSTPAAPLPQAAVVGETTSSGQASEKVTKKSTKHGLSSKLISPLCTAFPTFVIPQMPVGSGTDPSLIVSPVWVGPGSFSGLTSTMPYQTPPTNPPTSSSPSSTQTLPAFMTCGSNPLQSSNSTSTVASQASSSKQLPSLGYNGPLIGAFPSSSYSGLPAFPVDFQLKATTSTTGAKSISHANQDLAAGSRKGPSKLLSTTSNASKISSDSTTSNSSSISTTSTSPESSRPHVDKYGASAVDQRMDKTLQYNSLHESPHHSLRTSPSLTARSSTQSRSSTTSTSIMSPPTHIPTKFRFPSVSSPLSQPSSSLPSTTFSGLTTMLMSPSSDTNTLSPTLTTHTTLDSLSLTTQGGVSALASNVVTAPSSSKPLDVNSLEYRKFILKRVHQWNEHKKKMMEGCGEHTKLKPLPTFADGSVLQPSPTGDDTAHLGQPLRSSSSTFKFTTSSANTSRESSPVSSTILNLGSNPKLLTVEPPVTFAATLTPCFNSINTPTSLERKLPATTTTNSPRTHPAFLQLKSPSSMSGSTTSPEVVASVVSSAVRMDDIIAANCGSSVVAPSLVFNSSFMGDISSMSCQELEQLYKHNVEKLEQQKKLISILEIQLKRVREQQQSVTTQTPSQSEVYKRFLSFVVEPELIPDDSSTLCSDKFGYSHLVKQSKTKPRLDFNDIIKGGTFDRPVLNEKYDFYANFGHS